MNSPRFDAVYESAFGESSTVSLVPRMLILTELRVPSALATEKVSV